MALFKISKGKSENLPTNKVDGYCYVTTNDHKFYVDYTKDDGTLDRFALNAVYADSAGTATKLATARTISLGTGVRSTATSFDGSGNITIPVTSIKEAYLSWGGKNFNGSYGCIDAAMVSDLGANRLMFGKAAGITIQYSRDSGNTWIDYEASDSEKIGLFSSGYGFNIGKATKDTLTTDCMLRVIIDSNAFGVYTSLNKFVIYLSTSGSSGCYCTIDASLESSPTTFTTFADKVPVSGWSGYNVINTSSITTYGNSPSNQYGLIRFTFGCTEITNTNYAGLSVYQIMGFGGVGWSTPSTMAKTGHLYSYDSSQNATFPAEVTATTFRGVATSSYSLQNKGTLDTQDKIDNFLTANQVTYATFKTADSNNIGMTSNDGMILSLPWISTSYGTQIAFDDSTSGTIKIRGKSNSWGSWYTLLHSGNYTDYTVKKDGSGASGTWGINISGTAAAASSVAWSNVSGKPSTYTPSSHTHDDRYYTESEINSKLSGKSDTGHTHSYAGSASAGGSANSAVKLDSSAGSATQPIYFSGGKPTQCNSTLGVNISGNAATATKATQDGNGNTISSTYLPLSAGENKKLTGPLGLTKNVNYGTSLPSSGFTGQLFFLEDGDVSQGDLPIASATVSGIVTTGTQTFAGNKTFNNNVYFGANGGYGYVDSNGIHGAMWNDYAEFRNQFEDIEPGYCVASTDDGKVYKTTEKFQACDGIVSDTFGFSIGKTNECKTPLAVAGRVLAYCEGERSDYHAGDTVCAGVNGLVCKMTREEIKEYPDRIIGIVSEIPDYETWGSGNVPINERIWIKVK